MRVRGQFLQSLTGKNAVERFAGSSFRESTEWIDIAIDQTPLAIPREKVPPVFHDLFDYAAAGAGPRSASFIRSRR